MATDKVRLRERLVEIQGNGGEKKDIMLLFDSSGSIKADQWQAMKKWGTLYLGFCARANQKVRFFVAQFSNKFQQEIAFTPNIDRAEEALTKMKPMGGGTATHTALDCARTCFEDYSDTATSRHVILFTDGHPDDQGAAVDAAEEVRETGVHLIGVYINSSKAKLPDLQEVCGKDHSFYLSTFKDLADILPSPTSAPVIGPNQPIRGSDIIFHFKQAQRPIGLEDPLPLDIAVENNSTEVEVKEGAVLVLDGEPFWTKKNVRLPRVLAPGECEDMHVVLQSRAGMTVHDLPDMVKVTLCDAPKMGGGVYVSKSTGFDIDLDNMCGDLVGWEPPLGHTQVNILVIGPPGHGKSTLTNSLYSLPKRALEVASIAHGSGGHVTKRTKLIGCLEGYRFLDTYGMTQDNYTPSIIDAVLLGELPEGFSLDDSIDDASVMKTRERHRATREEREIHAVIVVITHQFLRERQEVIGRLQALVEHAVSRDLMPLVAVTHVDELDATEVEDVKTEVQKMLGTQRAHIYMLDNSDPAARVMGKEKVKYALLWEALRAAADFIARKNKQASRKRIKVEAEEGHTCSWDEWEVLEVSSRRQLGCVYAPLTMQMRVGDLREPIEDQIRDLECGGFSFVSVRSKHALGQPQEAKAQAGVVVEVREGGLPKVHVRTTG